MTVAPAYKPYPDAQDTGQQVPLRLPPFCGHAGGPSANVDAAQPTRPLDANARLLRVTQGGVERIFVDHNIYDGVGDDIYGSPDTYLYPKEKSELDLRASVLCQAALAAPVLLWGVRQTPAQASASPGWQQGAQPGTLDIGQVSEAFGGVEESYIPEGQADEEAGLEGDEDAISGDGLEENEVWAEGLEFEEGVSSAAGLAEDQISAEGFEEDQISAEGFEEGQLSGEELEQDQISAEGLGQDVISAEWLDEDGDDGQSFTKFQGDQEGSTSGEVAEGLDEPEMPAEQRGEVVAPGSSASGVGKDLMDEVYTGGDEGWGSDNANPLVEERPDVLDEAALLPEATSSVDEEELQQPSGESLLDPWEGVARNNVVPLKPQQATYPVVYCKGFGHVSQNHFVCFSFYFVFLVSDDIGA